MPKITLIHQLLLAIQLIQELCNHTQLKIFKSPLILLQSISACKKSR